MNIFEYPFLFKTLLTSLYLSVVFALLGIFVFIKRMSFFSDGVAHASILGLAIAFLLKKNILFFALLSGIIFSFLIYYLERKTKIHSDTLIGLIFVSSLSLGLILMSLKASYQPELLNFLIGNILTISDFDFILIFVFSLIITSFLILNLKKLVLVLIDPIEAKLRNIKVNLYELIFYCLLGISVILGIKLVGVILVTAFLVISPSISSLISRSFSQFIFFSIIFNILNSLLGFFVSNIYNFPFGASIVLIGSILFFIFFLFIKLC
jgi:ABC-type Mn2+/Zn2+ transport system permease subunit